jgi:hypothetical protein
MADVANADEDDRLGGAGLDDVATGATHFRGLVLRMNVSFHVKKASKTSICRGFDKR